jgi:hypothetical protein
MRRLIRWVVFLGIVCGLAYGASYVGARAAAGKFLGPEPPLTGRQATFAFKGVEALEGTPRVWVFTYARSALPGVSHAVIYVSPTGRIVKTQPANLDALLDAWEKAQEP